MLSIFQYSSIYGNRFYHSVCLLFLAFNSSLFKRVLPEGHKNSPRLIKSGLCGTGTVPRFSGCSLGNSFDNVSLAKIKQLLAVKP